MWHDSSLLCKDDWLHMLHPIFQQPVPAPVLNAQGLSVQMVLCDLLCSLDSIPILKGSRGVNASN